MGPAFGSRVPSLLLAFTAAAAYAQFTVVGPAPYTEPVAREKIRALLKNADADTQKQTISDLSRLLSWYRDLIDEELVAAWQQNPGKRGDFAGVIDTLTTPRVAAGVMEFSWRERDSAFRVAYAPLYEHLMTRYAESGRPMLNDLLTQPPPELSEPVAETVCRILIDMPEGVGVWRQSALRILPRYRSMARRLLAADARSSDSAVQDRALFWLDDPRSTLYDGSGAATDRTPPRLARTRASSGAGPNFVGPGADAPPAPVAVPASPAAPPAPPSPPHGPPPHPESYSGPRSGTLECAGTAIPQNAEYVFRNLPAAKLQLEYDTKIWDGRLVLVDGQTQKLVLRNKAAGAQKRCTVHWTVSQ